MKKIIPIIAAANFNKHRKKPRIIIRYSNGKKKYFDQKSLLNSNPAHCKLVEEKVDKINMRIALGVYEDVEWKESLPLITISQLETKWIDYRQRRIEAGKLQPTTLRNDKITFLLFRKLLGNLALDEVTPEVAREFVRRLRNLPKRYELGIKSYEEYDPKEHGQYKPILPRTDENISAILRAISPAFTWAIRENIWHSNPFTPLPELEIKNPRENINIFLPSQLEKFREYFKDCPPGHMAAFEFSLGSGARAGGIAVLNESDIFTEIIDGNPATLALLHEKGRNGSKKTRVIYLYDSAKAALDIMRIWYDRVDEYVYQFNINHKLLPEFQKRVQSGKVFFCFKTSQQISQMFRRARIVCRLKGKFHDLRKTHSTELYDAGMSKDAIQDVLGHSERKVMENHYLAVTITRIVRQARKIEHKL